jgi:hypothetical protein
MKVRQGRKVIVGKTRSRNEGTDPQRFGRLSAKLLRIKETREP